MEFETAITAEIDRLARLASLGSLGGFAKVGSAVPQSVRLFGRSRSLSEPSLGSLGEFKMRRTGLYLNRLARLASLGSLGGFAKVWSAV